MSVALTEAKDNLKTRKILNNKPIARDCIDLELSGVSQKDIYTGNNVIF